MMVPLDPMGPAVVNGGGGPGAGGGRGGGNDVPLGSGGGINTISIATVGANASLRRRADDDYRNTLMRSEFFCNDFVIEFTKQFFVTLF